MARRTLLAWSTFLLALPMPAQDSLAVRTARLHEVLARAATLTPDEAWSDSLRINVEIERCLSDLLALPMADSTFERVTRHEHLVRAHSKDLRLWTFHWYENMGGTFHSYCHVFHLRTAGGQGVTVGDDEDFCDSRTAYSEIHRLRTKGGERLYLAMGSVRGCATCCGNVAVVFHATKDTLDLAYPAFSAAGGPDTPCHVLDARCGDLLQWAFNAREQRIDYVFRVDDLSPIPESDDVPGGIVRGALRFDGQRFTEQMGPVEKDTYPQP